MAKIQNFNSFGGCIPHISAPINVKCGMGEHVYRGNESPLWGEKPISGPLSKNNTVHNNNVHVIAQHIQRIRGFHGDALYKLIIDIDNCTLKSIC